MVFLVNLKTPKGHFEINWPLVVSRHERYQLFVKFSLSLPANDPVKCYLLTEHIFFLRNLPWNSSSRISNVLMQKMCFENKYTVFRDPCIPLIFINPFWQSRRNRQIYEFCYFPFDTIRSWKRKKKSSSLYPNWK